MSKESHGKEAPASVDFSALKRRPSRLPPPPEDASTNLTAPELMTVGPAAAPPPLPESPRAAVRPQASESRRRVTPYVAPEMPPEAYDGRSRLRTGRTEPFSTRVRPDFRGRLIALADRLECTMAEALERAVAALEREQNSLK